MITNENRVFKKNYWRMKVLKLYMLANKSNKENKGSSTVLNICKNCYLKFAVALVTWTVITFVY